jgi:hypothetical protein
MNIMTKVRDLEAIIVGLTLVFLRVKKTTNKQILNLNATLFNLFHILIIACLN